MARSNHEPITVGEKFFSYVELQNRLEEHKQATMSDYWIKDSNTLKSVVNSAPRCLTANPALRYYYVVYACIYGGKYKPKGDPSSRKRKFMGSFRQGCPVEVSIILSKDGQHLYVRKVTNNHNHELNPSILRIRPGSKARIASTKAADSDLKCCLKKIVHEGYVYTQIPPMRKGRMYLKCVSEHCPGRAKKMLGQDGKCCVIATKTHMHDADPHALQRLEFTDKLIKRAQKDALSLARIFELESHNFPVLNVEFEQFSDLMSNARVTTLPLVPKTLQDFSFIMVSEEWCNRFACNREEQPRELFMGMVKGKGGETAIVFASVYLSEVMNKPLSELYIDVGYKRFPDKPAEMKFLLSIHFLQDNCSFAGVYAVMSSRSLAACMAVLKFVKDELLPNCTPQFIYTSYEAEIQLACRDIFSGANVQGATFYFSKEVQDKFEQLQLSNNEKVKPLLLSCMALPLLPSSLMESGLNAIASTVGRSNLGPKPIELVQHIRFSLLEGIGATDISAHEQPQRSNLNLKNWYEEMDTLSQKRMLTAWRFVEMLQIVEESHRLDHQQLIAGGQVQDIHQCSVAVEDFRITEALEQLNIGNIGIMDFLGIAANVIA